MKYPLFCNFIIRKRIRGDDEYDCLMNEELGVKIVAKKEFCDFCCSLNGKTDPYSLGYPRETVDKYLAYLNENELLREERLVHYGLHFSLTLSFHNYIARRKRCFCLLYSTLLSLFFIPIFIAGIVAIKWNYWFYDSPIVLFYIGSFLGTLLGISAHEFGHYTSTVAYGGIVYETGIGWDVISPYAYVMNDVSNIRSRLLRMQINAAGVETNLTLCGINLCVASLSTISSLFFVGAAFANLFMGLLNSLPTIFFSMKLDGAHVLEDATNKDIIKQSLKRTFFKKDRSAVLKSKYGKIKWLGSLILSCIQFILPAYYIYVFINIVKMIFE